MFTVYAVSEMCGVQCVCAVSEMCGVHSVCSQ